MAEALPAAWAGDPLSSRFARWLAERVGLAHGTARWPDLAQALAPAAAELGYADPRTCMESLLSRPPSREELDILVTHLTVGETYFFRDPALFAALQTEILPPLIAARRGGERSLRLWSAGCSTGEEAYSLAITLARLLPDRADWRIALHATDINPRALRHAARAAYGRWSFRGDPSLAASQWFEPLPDGRVEVAPALRALVSFARLNLVEDAFPPLAANAGPMDVIFCRNVLMYFTPERAKAVAAKLAASLAEGGWLVVSPVELSLVARPELEPVRRPGLILLRKGRAAAPPEARPGSAVAAGETRPGRRRAEQARPPGAGPRPRRAPLPPRDHAATWAERARAHADRGELAEARRYCEQALAAEKLNPAWNYLLASILLEQDEPDAAQAALRRTLYLDPEHVLAHFALASLLRRRGRAEGARQHLRNALALLERHHPQHRLPEADGLPARRLGEIIRRLMETKP